MNIHEILRNSATSFLYAVLLLILLIFQTSCSHSQTNLKATPGGGANALVEFKLTIPAFGDKEPIPSVYTCDSLNVSPELRWTNPLGKVRSYALIMDDPDAPMQTWVHWVIFNIPDTCESLHAHFPTDSITTLGIRQGITSFGTCGYGGPCPPKGTHRYYFKLFALDTLLGVPCITTSSKKLSELMKGHILAESDVIGTYHRKSKTANGNRNE